MIFPLGRQDEQHNEVQFQRRCQKRGAEIIAFAKCSYKSGYMVLHCKYQETALWLKDVTRSLVPWENAELVALDVEDIPRPEIFHAFFPLGAAFNDERIRGLIESQNSDITTKNWQIINRTNANRHAERTLYMDEDSLQILAKRQFMLNFRFGETQIRKMKQRPRQNSKPKVKKPERTDPTSLLPNDSIAGPSGAKLLAPRPAPRDRIDVDRKNSGKR
ncbi:uncharacterized protein LOC129716615 [Wyeomyia smithii]|uniref:uncharacterized protein LOC129716615 n=1 Tax=Wyeomyia smithii TaxID=174621 RepID=UPI002467E855|nr:uncharacterized protein LOC129716615 [Wyeomyia smithii]